jgi:hypothetical protein
MSKNNTSTGPLLSYTESTIPSPLQVSTATPTSGQIIFSVASNPNVLCKQIVISVPISDLDVEVYSATPTPTASVNSTDWSISIQMLPGENLGYIAGINYAVFTLDNNAAGYVLNAFAVTITGNVNTVISSNAQVELAENSSPVVKPNYTVKSATYTVVKAAPPAFYVNNFISTLAGTPTVPATEFANGAGFQLSWEINGTFFKVYQKGTTSPVYSGTAASFQVSSGIATDTTFVLEATLADATLYDAITVTVTNPSLTPKTIVSSGDIIVGSNLSVTGTIASSGAATVGSDLSVAGAITTDSIHINKNLEVSGNTVLSGSLEVDSNLQVNGAMGVNGQVLATSGAVISTGGNPGGGPGYPLLITDGGLGSGVAIAWNYSGGTGETDFFNYGQGGDGGFNFYNNGHCGGAYPTSSHQLLMSINSNGGIVIGNWTICVDGNNNLCFNSNNNEGNVLINGKQVIKSGDPCNITNDLGSLNGTNRAHGPSSNDAGIAYWSNSADNESNLTINYVDPS